MWDNVTVLEEHTSDTPHKVGTPWGVRYTRLTSIKVQYCKRDEVGYTSQHCCDKTVDGKMALYRDCCFPIAQNRGE